jgi:hypothetical protein
MRNKVKAALVRWAVAATSLTVAAAVVVLGPSNWLW